MGDRVRPRLYHPDRPATNAERQRAFAQRRKHELADLRKAVETKLYHRSQRHDWETPPAVFAEYDAEFHFTLDVCATAATAKCARFFSPEDDGLEQDWGREICWMNPPYGTQIGFWMAKAYLSSLAGATVVCLVPSRTDTLWWHAWVQGKGDVRVRKGRITFVGAPNSAGFPSVAVIYRPCLVG
jgi:phage N-6-adenine-methyltransferase